MSRNEPFKLRMEPVLIKVHVSESRNQFTHAHRLSQRHGPDALAHPYGWMEEMDAPEMPDWVAVQNELVEPYLASISLRQRLRERLTEVWIIEDHYDVPLNCFVPTGGELLLVAGRCLSAHHEAMVLARVTAQCFSFGHAVGHAAAMAVRTSGRRTTCRSSSFAADASPTEPACEPRVDR